MSVSTIPLTTNIQQTSNVSKAVTHGRSTTLQTVSIPSGGMWLVLAHLDFNAGGTSSFNNTLLNSGGGSRTVRTTEGNGGGSINAMVVQGGVTITHACYTFTIDGTARSNINIIKLY